MRVLLTGMGGDFGAKTAALVEADPTVEAVLGIDAYPPRRRLHHSRFLRIDPRDTARTGAAVRRSSPPWSCTSACGSPTPGPSPPSPTAARWRVPRPPWAPPCPPGSWSTSSCGPASRSTAAGRPRRGRPTEEDAGPADVAVWPDAAGRRARPGPPPARLAEVPVAHPPVRPDGRRAVPEPPGAPCCASRWSRSTRCRSPRSSRPSSPCSTSRTSPPRVWPPSGAAWTAR